MFLFEALARWDEQMSLTHSVATRRHYRYLVLRAFADLMVTPDELSEAGVVAYLASLPARGHTRVETTKALRSFFAWLSRRYGVPDPVRDVNVHQPRQGPAPSLSDAELRAVFRAAFRKDRKRGWALMFLAATGARRESACAVKPADISDGIVHFRQAKGDRPYAVPLGRMGRIAVRHLLDLGGETLIPVKSATLWDWAHQSGVAAGVHFYPHLARHVYAHKLGQRTDPRTWMDLLNHADLSQYRRYTWASDDRKREAVENL